MTESPGFTAMEVTVPVVSDSILFCIFMASSTRTTSPAFTLSPTFTFTSVIVPGSGDLIAVPAPAGAGVGAGAAAGAAAGAFATGLGASTFTLFSELVGLMGCFSSTSKGMPFTFTLAMLPSTSSISTS